MSLYRQGVNASQSLIGPYKRRVDMFALGSRDFYKGSRHFYTRGHSGMAVGGAKSWIIELLTDIVHIMLVVGGVYLVFNAIFA